jgi:hypothetical protein
METRVPDDTTATATTSTGPTTTRLYAGGLSAATSRHERMMAEARGIIDAGNERGVVLRLTGGLAVRHYAIDLEFAERDYSDIDLIGLKRQSGEIVGLFGDLGYVENLHVATATGLTQRQFFLSARDLASHRHIAKRGGTALPVYADVPPSDHVDVFLDAMKMDHEIEMRDRLTINTYAVSPADIFLSKLQIVRLNEKDAHDVITLCKDVYVDFEDHPGVLNLSRVADVCAEDWGLYVDLMGNIDIVLDRLASYDLTVREFTRVRRTLELAQDTIAETSKTLRWRLRAKVGKRVKWYRDVEETMPGRRGVADVAVRTKVGREA